MVQYHSVSVQDTLSAEWLPFVPLLLETFRNWVPTPRLPSGWVDPCLCHVTREAQFAFLMRKEGAMVHWPVQPGTGETDSGELYFPMHPYSETRWACKRSVLYPSEGHSLALGMNCHTSTSTTLWDMYCQCKPFHPSSQFSILFPILRSVSNLWP